MGVKDFRELDVYRSAVTAAVRIYRESKPFPVEERFALTSQIRRSARSVCANIAESWDKRGYPALFASTLAIASGEAAETITWIEIALGCELWPAGSMGDVIATYDAIRAQLRVMIRDRHLWCHPP